MWRLLVFVSILLQLVHCSCPTGFDLVREGECRGKYTTISSNWNDATSNVISSCKAIQGNPIIIHNAEHQSYWKPLVPSGYLYMGIVCNKSTKRWEWSDGSKMDYRPAEGYDSSLDRDCVNGWSWNMHSDGVWTNSYGTMIRSVDVFCTTQLEQAPAYGCDSFDNGNGDGVCYQVRANPQNWTDAIATCRNIGATVASIHNLQDNSFVRRLAVSNGATNGIFIGAARAGNSNSFSWIDGSAWDFSNFFPGFPVIGQGDCLAMDTFGAAGEWMNVPCSSKLAVACARRAGESPVCSGGPWKEGQMIYSPGYPYDASIPCDYFLTVDAGKRLQVEILQLEANSCCDHLVLGDSALGGNIVANLTGEISDRTYTTKSSNVMRVSWQPRGGVNVQGVMFTYRGVW